MDDRSSIQLTLNDMKYIIHGSKNQNDGTGVHVE